MGRTCTICSNPQVANINREVRLGGSERVVANQFEVNRSALHRHISKCLARGIIRGQAEERIKTIPEAPSADPEPIRTMDPEPEPIVVEPEPAPPEPKRGFSAYDELITLGRMLDDLIGVAKEEGTFAAIAAIRERRGVIDSMVKAYETQKRTESMEGSANLSSTRVHEWLKERHPGLIPDLVAYLKEARQEAD